MTRKTSSLLWLAAIGPLLISGCGTPDTTKPAEQTEGEHAHEHSHGHGHEVSGPHGGHLIEPGEEAYHLE